MKSKRIISILLVFILMFTMVMPTVAASTKPLEKRDTVLLLDVSGSMWGTPISVMKSAAKKFCDSVLNASGINRVAIVAFESDYDVFDFSNSKTDLNNYIDQLTDLGGTNLYAACEEANDLLTESDSDTIKNIVILTDGLPQSGPESYSGKYSSSDESYYYSYANSVYSLVKSFSSDYNIYTLGFFHSLYDSELTFAQKFLSDLQTKGYYNVTDPDDLEFTFGEIAEEIIENNYPIVFIPGIMGSRLFMSNTVFDNSTKAWDPNVSISGITQLSNRLNVNNTLYVRPCENQNIDVSKNDTKSTVDDYGKEYGAQDTYKEIINELCEEYTYEDTTKYRPVYFFSYDWRKSNSNSAVELKKAIDKVITETGSKKVDLVCHSMGGLVASKYYKEYSNEGKVNKVITCGTPYEGAPKLLNSVMNYDVLGIGANIFKGNTWIDWVLGILGGLDKDIKKSFSGVVELTPTENYVSKIKMQKDAWYPFSLGDYEITTQEYQKICAEIFGKNSYNSAVTFQNSLHSSNSNYNALLDYENSYFSIGVNQKTITAVKFQYSNNGIDQLLYESDLSYDTKGDGTVPYLSASIIEQIEKLPESRWKTFSTDHSGVVKEKDCIEWIVDILNVGNSEVKGDNMESKSYIVIRIACPVDVKISNKNGTLNSASGDLTTFAEFGRLDFIGKNDEIKMLCLDEDKYNVVLNGTGNGTMNYEIRWFNKNNKLVTSRTFSDIPINENTIITTSTDKNKNIVLNVDLNGDGIVDNIIQDDDQTNGSQSLSTLLQNIEKIFELIFAIIKAVVNLIEAIKAM